VNERRLTFEEQCLVISILLKELARLRRAAWYVCAFDWSNRGQGERSCQFVGHRFRIRSNIGRVFQ
jgi:hypothetical protein